MSGWKVVIPGNSVIPAEAKAVIPAEAGSQGAPPRKLWVPACAGMTPSRHLRGDDALP